MLHTWLFASPSHPASRPERASEIGFISLYTWKRLVASDLPSATTPLFQMHHWMSMSRASDNGIRSSNATPSCRRLQVISLLGAPLQTQQPPLLLSARLAGFLSLFGGYTRSSFCLRKRQRLCDRFGSFPTSTAPSFTRSFLNTFSSATLKCGICRPSIPPRHTSSSNPVLYYIADPLYSRVVQSPRNTMAGRGSAPVWQPTWLRFTMHRGGSPLPCLSFTGPPKGKAGGKPNGSDAQAFNRTLA
ncbi:hypothetical protein QBC39DRAFT_38219 [Podospora conica]|nr:hypothetical protein QBC39DRAFT_38219 [Schizothecium conicum]